MKTGAVLTLIAAIVLIGGAAVRHWYDDAEAGDRQVGLITAQGTVTSNDVKPPTRPPATPHDATIPQGAETTTSTDKQSGDKHHRLMSLALARAHDGLEKNALHTARSGIYWALSLEPDNREALALKQELLSRESARNAALKAARACVGQERAQCVLQNARNALAIDSGSTEAKALVAHTVVDPAKLAKPPGVAAAQSDGPMVQ